MNLKTGKQGVPDRASQLLNPFKGKTVNFYIIMSWLYAMIAVLYAAAALSHPS
ncbi:hypothetical protein VSR68_39350 [Paraburkholderia phymatum]|uniref:hypothetical protein n=1 Tax=Paraburkholderia phymatum TaxID=148447 RepID=UPI00317C4ABC